MLKNYLTCRLQTMRTFYVRKRNSMACILYVLTVEDARAAGLRSAALRSSFLFDTTQIHSTLSRQHTHTHIQKKQKHQHTATENFSVTTQNRRNLHFYLSILCFGFCFNSFLDRRFTFYIDGTVGNDNNNKTNKNIININNNNNNNINLNSHRYADARHSINTPK